MRNINDFIVNKRKLGLYRFAFIIVCGLFLVLSFSVAQTKANNDKPLEKVILQLSWYHEFHFAGYYAAQLKGYYQEEGLDVEIRERNLNQLPVDAVLSGDADFANATSDIMFLRMQGNPVVALAVIMQHSPWVLLARADSGITVPEDLIGKTVSMDMSYRDVEIQAMFKNENISAEKITVVRKEPGVENLINGTVDARVSYITSQPFELQKQGFEARVLRPVNYGVDFYGDTLFTSERQIREYPQRVAAFRRASLRGWQYAMDHPEELIDYIYSTYYADPTQASVPYSRDHFRFEAKVMAEYLVHPKLIEIGQMNPNRWQRIADTYTALGMAEPIDTLKGFIYDSNPKPDYKWVYWTIGIIVAIFVIIGVCVAILYEFNKRLSRDVQLRTSELTQINKTLVQEISQRKQAEIQIRKLSRVVEQSPSIVVMTDTKGNIEYVNTTFTQATGYRFEEAVGKNTRILKSCETSQEVYEQLWKTITSGQEWRGEFNNRKKNGELFWESACIIPIKDDEGDIINFVAIKEDETERRKVKEELRESEERFRTLSKATFEGIVFHREGVIIDCNEQFANMVGYGCDDLIGMDGLMLVHPEDRKLARIRISTKNEDMYEFRLLCRDGSIKFAEAHAQMMAINAEISRVTVVRDITERKKMEDEIIKIQKLESVGVLAGGIAHDFNNNLQSIVSCVALAKTYANPEDEVYKKLEEAKEVVLQSKDLTQQLLTFSKGGEPVKNTISISKLIINSVNLALSGSNVRCELGIPDDLWPVEADKGQLNQVISNLIINANQAMPEGGNIKVWAENINVVEKDQIPLQQGRCVMISVTDQGVGISQEHIQNIFDPYFTTKEMGSGLGLATAYSIIKKHEGYITVESEVSVGTTFRIYLPASSKEIRGISAKSEEKRASTALVDKKNEEKPNVSKGKVLLMDDEALIRLFITQHMINLKYEVETVEDGAEAIGLYKRAMESDKPFDAVIMDLTIPGGMGGKEAIERLLEIDTEVRAIVASGYADDPIMAEFNKYGFSGVLVKPYEIHELDEALQKVIAEAN